uniref:Uncharacterized protein n=1 Tax=Musa acuminata subsp. malaccensis TaxID=214687 RepID=A0A804KFU6_MUSAM
MEDDLPFSFSSGGSICSKSIGNFNAYH